LSILALEIERATGLSRLEKHHPHRRQLRGDGAYRGTIGDLIFPLHQAGYLLGLGTQIACYNDDNAFVVDFTRSVGRTILAGRSQDLPTLRVRNPGHLLGRNGMRMCKANRNALGLLASPSEIRRFVGSVVGRGVGDSDPTASIQSGAELGLAALLSLSPRDLDGDARSRTYVLTESMCAVRALVEAGCRAWGDRDIGKRLARDEALAVAVIDSNVKTLLGVDL